MDHCVFCKIVAGEIPSTVVWENDHVIAFDDISPQAPVHTLVVPREHHVTLGDDMSEQLLGALMAAVPQVARLKGVEQSGYRVIVNNGRDAGQLVGHVHVHVLGGRAMAPGMVRFEGE
ncbi:MAG: histidine triad nucleotide-binding protein [Coriobacteriia bacterium]|nr:histidine triad nucleotide-binding protein [Coriobacteriia bacterium]